MTNKVLKSAGLTVALAAFGAVCMMSIKAQQDKSLPINWIRCVVSGRQNNIDPRILPGISPTADQRVELGLRSDGIVVWRRSPNDKLNHP
jgi:hypothetical protein